MSQRRHRVGLSGPALHQRPTYTRQAIDAEYNEELWLQIRHILIIRGALLHSLFRDPSLSSVGSKECQTFMSWCFSRSVSQTR
eukprot:scaffold58059_cov45-Attheya_sp.AAC.3